VMIKELLSGKYTGGCQAETEQIQRDKTVQEGRGTQAPEGGLECKEETGKGEHTLTAEAPPEEQENTKKQITNSLDDILLNYIMKRAK